MLDEAMVTELAQRYYTATARQGWGGRYFPAVIELIDRNLGPAPAAANAHD